MGRRGTLMALVTALAVAAVAPTALAAPPEGKGRPGPWGGERINILTIHGDGGFAQFPADTAFNVRHGWLRERTSPYAPPTFAALFDFRLEIDGIDQGPGTDYVERLGSSGAIYHSVYDFPAGLPAGTYDFLGRWTDADGVETVFEVQIEFVGAVPWIGDRINILTASPTEFPVDTAFHVRHGWLWEPDSTYTPEEFGTLFEFRLMLDGVDQGDGLLHVLPAGGGTLLYSWVFNFPGGLPEAAYEFEGVWIAPPPEVGFNTTHEVCFYSGVSC